MTQEQVNKLPTSVLIEGEIETLTVYVNGKKLRVEDSMRVRNHASEVNWGYGGSGPAQLALAILMKFMNNDEAHKYHQAFKFKVVGTWPQGQNFEERINLRQIMLEIIKQ